MVTGVIIKKWPDRYMYLLGYRSFRCLGDKITKAIPNGRACAPFMRPTDVIVAVPPKSGTTWVQHMCHQLRVRGAPPTFNTQVITYIFLRLC
jgi:hypothetical protein